VNISPPDQEEGKSCTHTTPTNILLEVTRRKKNKSKIYRLQRRSRTLTICRCHTYVLEYAKESTKQIPEGKSKFIKTSECKVN
jgi:hypothetical protein